MAKPKIGCDCIGVGCGVFIINDKSETLLLKRSRKSKNEAGFWNKPGGAVEFGETIDDSIRREIREELDVELGEIDERPVKVTKFKAKIKTIRGKKR